jgi:hypothetical protein
LPVAGHHLYPTTACASRFFQQKRNNGFRGVSGIWSVLERGNRGAVNGRQGRISHTQRVGKDLELFGGAICPIKSERNGGRMQGKEKSLFM